MHAVRFTAASRQDARGLPLQARRSANARFYEPDGSELELRLVDGPLDNWEQITSLLNDGRGHKGVDFKTPMGTPVKAPFDGVNRPQELELRAATATRSSIEETGGQHRHAFFLHLSELAKGDHRGPR